MKDYSKVWVPETPNEQPERTSIKIVKTIASCILGIVAAILIAFNHRFMINFTIPIGLVLSLLLLIFLSISVKLWGSNVTLVLFAVCYFTVIQWFLTYNSQSVLFVGGHIENSSWFSDTAGSFIIYFSPIIPLLTALVPNKKR
jgi:hypothetical protein